MSLALENLSSIQFELCIKVSLENILSFLEVYEQEARRYEAMFHYQRSEIGHLTESLISRAKLTKLLNAIHSEMSVEYLYRHFNVRLMSLCGDSLGFWVSIPIVSA